MTILHVDEVKLTQTGKAYSVKAGGRYYVAGKDSGIEQAGGRDIDATLGSFQGAQGKTVTTIDSFSYVDAVQKSLAPPSATNGDRWWLAFVSNQVAHAIAAGLIKEPVEMGAWARAAKVAILSAEEQAADVPF